jgi:phospholipase/lecithinase/hemolysin
MFLVDAALCFLHDFSGFKESSKGCCGTGLIEVAVLCNILCKTCTNASEYVFWDSYHPTQRAYEIIVYDIIEEALADLN